MNRDKKQWLLTLLIFILTLIGLAIWTETKAQPAFLVEGGFSGNHVVITWTTYGSFYPEEFGISRSIDGGEWEEMVPVWSDPYTPADHFRFQDTLFRDDATIWYDVYRKTEEGNATLKIITISDGEESFMMYDQKLVNNIVIKLGIDESYLSKIIEETGSPPLMSIRMTDIHGKSAVDYTVEVTGNLITIANIRAGRYLVEIDSRIVQKVFPIIVY